MNRPTKGTIEAEVANATLYLHFASMPEIPPPAADRKRHHCSPEGVVHLPPERARLQIELAEGVSPLVDDRVERLARTASGPPSALPMGLP